ncbi:molybdopterin molybdotransferase MoeA [Aureispira anguillae]|uniref:Molybdopterin molybdenumtransferase n=1 Tax=Aureispira anguillae TaxID=2864201 RepID=A0A916DQ45_9BACT|nr:gephyrin-like molybdotransferase Glp [Aureispira anguillae]BDS09880.1 molybdopterin molybdotransferase MoeA [Aureispira anguillae]
MIYVEEAKKIVKSLKYKQRRIELPLEDALGYVLAEAIYAPINMPPFDQSAMDGYALKLGKTLNYTLIDEVQAGSTKNPKMSSGEAVRIFTGAAIPSDADAVMMQEKTVRDGEQLRLEKQAFPGQNIRLLGEQIKKGALALDKGVLLTPASVGFLAGIGVQTVKVVEQPSIAIVVTGDELVKAGQDLKRGQIYESNGIMLAAAAKDTGFNQIDLISLKDDYPKTLEVLNAQIKTKDFVLISGGISVGDYDFVGKALLEIGVEQLFYKVRQKPGKPMFLGRTSNCTIFALPGNPAAALSCFYQYVLMALKQAVGLPNFELKKLWLPLEEAYSKKGERAHFLKAKISPTGVKILQKQSSAMLFSFAYADALIYIPHDKMTTAAGELVEVHLLP